jgi:aspartyl-tRNA(Asn)/glutamyl-tRNA(Gln) amidotransferase subunit C
MPITQADIEKVAQLAHLELAEEELKLFGPQMAEIVSYVEQLNELDTENVEPALGGLTPEGEATVSSRDDEITVRSARKSRSPKPRPGVRPLSGAEGFVQDYRMYRASCNLVTSCNHYA